MRETLRWRRRAQPLPPAAALASGAAAAALARRLLAADDLSGYRAVAARRCLLVAGEDLPWVEDIVYLGIDRAAPSLYLPTRLEPDWPLDLLEASLRRLGQQLPCALLPELAGEVGQPFVLGLVAAQPLDRERLAEWLAEG